MAEAAIERFQKAFGGLRDHRAGRKNRLRAGGFDRVVILRRDDATDYDHNVGPAVVGELRFELRHQRQMRPGERRNAEDMHVVFDRLTRRFGGCCKQRPDIDVEAEIGKGGRDHLLPAIVAVLTDLGDQNTRAPALILLEFGDAFLHPFDGVGHAGLPPVDAGNGLDLGPMAAEHLFQRQ